MSSESWVSLGLSILCAMPTLFIGPQWIKRASEIDIAAMASWTATFVFAGAFIGIGIGKSRASKNRNAYDRRIAELESQIVSKDQRIESLEASAIALEKSYSARLEDERAQRKEDLKRLARAEEENDRLRSLVGAHQTLESRYREKSAVLSMQLDERTRDANSKPSLRDGR